MIKRHIVDRTSKAEIRPEKGKKNTKSTQVKKEKLVDFYSKGEKCNSY